MFSKTTELSFRRFEKLANRAGFIILIYIAFTLSAAVVKDLQYYDIYVAMYKYAMHMVSFFIYILAASIFALMSAGFIFEDNELIDISLCCLVDWMLIYWSLIYLYLS